MKILRISLISAVVCISLMAGPIRTSFDGFTGPSLPYPTCGQKGKEKCPELPLTCFQPVPNGPTICIGSL